MKKLYMIIFAFASLMVLSSFNYVSSRTSQSSSQKAKVSSTTNKKVKKNKTVSKKNLKKQQNSEITETKIEITDEYRQLLEDDVTSLEVVVQDEMHPKVVAESKPKVSENNPNKVHYFIRSKDNPNFYEIK